MRQQGADKADIRAQLTRLVKVCLRQKTGGAACAKENEMIKHSIDKVKANRQPIAPIVAECNSYCAAAKSRSVDQAAGLPMKTIISKNTNFRLTSKLWTEAGQTNGSE